MKQIEFFPESFSMDQCILMHALPFKLIKTCLILSPIANL